MMAFYLTAVWPFVSQRILFIFDHLWQSTAVVAAAALLTLLLRSNQAKARYWIFLAAAVKFLVPFAWLIAIGKRFAWPSAQIVHTTRFVRMSFIDTVVLNQRFTPPINHPMSIMDAKNLIYGVLFAVWFCGFATVLFSWFMRWRRVTAAVRQSVPLAEGREREALIRLQRISGIRRPICIAASSANLEPGVFGIFRPVLLLPAGIADRLEDAQLEAIIAHELCHIRRRDNLAAALHMVIQATFWFHPLVWWLGARLVEERELACDEDVLRLGNQPQVYAEGILKVCKYYLESPLVCVAGVTGANLKKRIEGIMTHRIANQLDFGRKLLLATLGVAAVAGPIVIGLLNPPRSRAQSPAGAAAPKSFEVASIKPAAPGGRGAQFMMAPGGRVNIKNINVKFLIQQAYQVRDFQIAGGPGWLSSDRYDIVAKAEGDEQVNPEQMRTMMQGLLADRFKLAIHRETKELPVYTLVVGKNGPKLKETPDTEGVPGPDGVRRGGMQVRMGRGLINGQGMTMEMLATQLANQLGRTVIDKTGLKGGYEVKLEWTPEQGEGPAIQREGGADAPATTADSGPTIFTALQEQLGLRLESTKGPVTIIVIDSVEKATEN
jgi:bla regulator protein BlaR1